MAEDTTDYYQSGASPKEDDSSTPDKGDSMEDSALLPKSFFGSKELKVGSECKVKIEHLWEDEVEVSYVKHDKDKDEEDDDKSEDKPKKHKRRRDYSYDEFLPDRQVAMTNMAPSAAGPGSGVM